MLGNFVRIWSTASEPMVEHAQGYVTRMGAGEVHILTEKDERLKFPLLHVAIERVEAIGLPIINSQAVTRNQRIGKSKAVFHIGDPRFYRIEKARVILRRPVRA